MSTEARTVPPRPRPSRTTEALARALSVLRRHGKVLGSVSRDAAAAAIAADDAREAADAARMAAENADRKLDMVLKKLDDFTRGVRLELDNLKADGKGKR